MKTLKLDEVFLDTPAAVSTTKWRSTSGTIFDTGMQARAANVMHEAFMQYESDSDITMNDFIKFMDEFVATFVTKE